MNKKRIVLITDAFPYTKRYETFLETEIKYWKRQKKIELIIMPMHIDTYKRKIDSNIIQDDCFANFLSYNEKEIDKNLYKFLYIFKSIYRKIFWKEIFTELIKRPSIVKEFLLSMRKYEIYRDFFKEYLKKNNVDLFYTYWNTEVTYALQNLNTNLVKYSIITRVHGYDLYKERTFKNYMPLRKLFTKNINQVYTITNQAIPYLEKNYSYNKELIYTSKLGVEDRGIITKLSEENSFHIVSCSSLIPLKRVDYIIDALCILSENLSNMKIKWIHIGLGSLEGVLKEYAKGKLAKLNIEYCFLGSLSNIEVYDFYRNNKIDVFINVSESEGVPVSIMEAMSCYIPIIAPNIGGISDMVISNFNGILLDKTVEIKDIVSALEKVSYFKNIVIRKNSYQQFKKNYDASTNYPIFIEKIKELMSDD